MSYRLAPNELLPHFTRLVAAMEKGQYPPSFPDHAKAIQALVGEICIAPWQTAEDRNKAQGLVLRLTRLKAKDKAAVA